MSEKQPSAVPQGETITVPPAPPAHDVPTLAPEPIAVADQTQPHSQQVPGYEILGELGRGGMGVVYKAQQTTLKRLVALKMILTGSHASALDIARFQAEAVKLARSQHPNIVQVHDVGDHEGRPYLVMEFLEGGSLEDKLAATPLHPRPAAELAATLARAIHVAHERGIIHRDLKPANVLFASDDIPKISDFGLSKGLDLEVGQTAAGAIMGTPSYMAPEQAAGRSHEVGPAADVYALGAILYECLTGRPPFRAATPFDTLMQVVSEEPVPVRQLNTKIPRDLETICHKCLQKDPRKRYASAAALAEDIKRFQESEPIAARPVGWPERALRWARRRPAVAALLLLVAVLTVSGLGAFGWAYGEALRERSNALAEAENARQQLAHSKVALAAAAWREGQGSVVQDRLNEVPADLRNWEWRYLKRLTQSIFTLYAHASAVTDVAFSPDGTRLATASHDGTLRVWDARTGRELLTPKDHKASVFSVAFSPDGTRLATGSGDPFGDRDLGKYGEVKVWDARTGLELLILKGHTGWVNSVAFSPDGTRLATGSGDKTARVWDARTCLELLILKGHTDWVHSVAFNPDGTRLATASNDGTARMWDACTGQELFALHGHGGRVSSVAFSPDGLRLATGSASRITRVWDARTGQQLFALRGHTGGVSSVAFSPDGTRLATGAGDKGNPGEVKVWDARTGQELFALKGHTDTVISVAFSPDGTRLVTASNDNTAKVWDARTDQKLFALKGHMLPVKSMAFSPDGTQLATGAGVLGEPGEVKVWDARTGQVLFDLPRQTCAVHSVAFSPDGTRLATGAGNIGIPGEAKVWDARRGQELFVLKGHTSPVNCVVFSPDGTRLATASNDGAVRVWDARTGRELLTSKDHKASVFSVAFSPDGTRLATASQFETARVWDATSGQEIFGLKGHTREVNSVAFSPDGTRLATGSHDQTARVWDATTGQELFSLKGHTAWVHSVAFNPDGTRLATGAGEYRQPGEVKVWDARTGQELFILKGHTDMVYCVAFSPDGTRLATGSRDNTARVWDARPLGEPNTLDAWEIGGRMWNTRFDPFWHTQQADHSDLANHPDTRAFHREQLLAAFPSRKEHVSDLRTAWTEVVRRNPEQSRAWRHLVLAQLFASQAAPALRTCADMRQHFTAPAPVCQAIQLFRAAPHDALTFAAMAQFLNKPALLGGTSDFDRLLTARTCVLHPQGLPEPLAWLPAVPEAEPRTHAALLSRAGQHAEAIALLQPLKEPRAHLWRALAEHERGDKAAAKKAFDEALAEMEHICPSDPKADATPLPWEQRAEYEILKREVQAHLKP